MAGWRQVGPSWRAKRGDCQLTSVSRSRTERASRVERARMLLAYRENPSFFAVAQQLGAHHQTVQRCVEAGAGYGPLGHLMTDTTGKEPTITADGQGLVGVSACDKAREHGYPHKL